MISSVPAVENCITTGATWTTCGSFASTSAIFSDRGAPDTPAITVVPGGMTTTSAPKPAWRWRESFRMPRERPTISRIRVTSSAMAIMLITERTGRCTRLATIMRFIMSACLLSVCSLLGLRLAGPLVHVYNYRSGRLLQGKLVVGERLIQLQFYNLEQDRILLLRPPDINLGGEFYPVVILKIFIAGVRNQVAVLVVDELPMWQQVGAAEDNLARQEPSLRALSNDFNLVVGLLHPVTFGV